MRDISILDEATVDVLHAMLERSARVRLVGDPSAGAAARLATSLGGRLATADGSEGGPDPAKDDAVVVLGAERLEQAQAAVASAGTLIVAVVNPRYGWFLLRALEGHAAPGPPAPDLDRVCAHLERAGWEIADATPVTVPLALLPFDPGRMPKTVLAYLYARHPELETYCVLLRARRAGQAPRRFRLPAVAPADVPTMPWKTEGEWRAEHTPWPQPPADALAATDARMLDALEHSERMVHALRLDLRRREEELAQITSSLTWRAIVVYRTLRERALPPATRRGRVYERVRTAVGRVVRGGGGPGD